MIKLVSVSKKYKTTSHSCYALKKVSLTFQNQGLVAILGPSGCGKTTLLNILGGLDQPTHGSLIIDGKNTQNFTEQDFDSYRNQTVGFVFQNYYLIPHLTVYDNVALALEMSKEKHDIKNKVLDALKEVGLLDIKNAKPSSLSGGQMQRVAIARALINNPSIILADEPTGALDSKNAAQVMSILKKISKKHLVVMVTHNQDMAEEYADRIIELLDGKIIHDSRPITRHITSSFKPTTKVRISFKHCIKWSLNNLWNKKLRSALTIFAGSIGIMGMGIILSMTSGVNEYIDNAQSQSLGKYPVMITSYLKNSSESHKDELTEYPDTDYIIIEKGDIAQQEHVNQMPDDFYQYMQDMDSSCYTVMDSNSYLQFPIITKCNDQYKLISSRYFTKTVDNLAFAKEQYDVLEGKMPESINELAIVVDNYNRIDVSLLDALGFDVQDETISFDFLLNQKEFHVIPNDLYYIIPEGENHYYAKGNLYYNDLYNAESGLALKIVGVLRENKSIKTPLFEPGILYTPSLSKYIQEQANQSHIVQEQLLYGLDKDVFTGEPFEDIANYNYAYSKQYQYERRLFSLGAKEQITQLYYYTSSFEQRFMINDYFSSFTFNEEASIIVRSYDYIELVTNEFSTLVTLFSNILLVFSGISILVSVLLISILMYISVLERSREIGLLRSLGARKKDVARIFLSEAFTIGVLSGILGIILAIIFNRPLSNVTKSLLAQYTSSMLNNAALNLDHFRFWVAPIMLITSILVTLIAGVIPAIKASKKKPAEALKDDI